MEHNNLSTLTVIYSCEESIKILHEVMQFQVSADERIEIPESFKDGKIIIAVCEGDVPILNKLGDRAFQLDHSN